MSARCVEALTPNELWLVVFLQAIDSGTLSVAHNINALKKTNIEKRQVFVGFSFRAASPRPGSVPSESQLRIQRLGTNTQPPSSS